MRNCPAACLLALDVRKRVRINRRRHPLNIQRVRQRGAFHQPECNRAVVNIMHDSAQPADGAPAADLMDEQEEEKVLS